MLIGGSTLVLAVLADHRPGGQAGDDPTSLLVLAAAWASWALSCYLVGGVAVAATSHLRRMPATGPRLATHVVPASLRRLVAATVGASATAMVVTVLPAAAWADSPAPPAPAATASPLDWPGLAAPSPAPVRHLPAPAVGLVSPRHHRGWPRPDELVVRPGDSLWSLAARRLGAGAPATAIAAEWPRLYAANRTAIGPDPNLIHPGQRLTPPAPDERTPR
jgi:nucleoid-associated protein YgaU